MLCSLDDGLGIFKNISAERDMEALIALMLFLLSLCFFPGSPAGAGCSGDRDCQCSDSSFGRCTEGVAGEKMHVSSLRDCIFQCDVSGFWRC